MIEKLVVAVDGGDASVSAVHWVAVRADHWDVAVDITTVIPIDKAAKNRPKHDKALAVARNLLRHTRARRLLVEHTRHGDPIEELVAASRDADLLVVGTNRTSGLASLLHLTIPLQLAGKVACPLVVVPAGWQHKDGPIVVGWEDDGSSHDAVNFAAAEAVAASRKLHLVHSWTLPPVNALDPHTSAALYTSVQRNQRDLLDREVRRVRARFPSVRIDSVLTTDSADIALERMGRLASLLVVGSHGHGAIADLLVGSVGDELIRAMTCPVAIVPAKDGRPIPVYPTTIDGD